MPGKEQQEDGNGRRDGFIPGHVRNVYIHWPGNRVLAQPLDAATARPTQPSNLRGPAPHCGSRVTAPVGGFSVEPGTAEADVALVLKVLTALRER